MGFSMKANRLFALLIVCYCVMAPVSLAGTQVSFLPPGFVYVDQVIPGIKLNLRYYTEHNFVGERIDGYLQPRCILSAPAAQALKAVQDDLQAFGLGLKIFDAYRPQRAVDHFVRWAKDLQDTKMQAEFYPDVQKENLFKEQYIAEKSSHSRGSTVDLTITPLDAASSDPGLDMGSRFDFFGPKSWPTSMKVSPSARSHRMLLHVLMIKHGFKPYPQEWWHFTLSEEPFPETYFDFSVQ